MRKASKFGKRLRSLYVSLNLDDFPALSAHFVKFMASFEKETFSNLLRLTINSNNLIKLNEESTAALLDILGGSLRYLSFFPTSPRGTLGLLNSRSPNLRFLRLDAICHLDLDLPYVNPNVEEIVVSYPANEYQYRGALDIPNLRKFTISGVTDNIEECVTRLSALPAGLEYLDIGGSSACASNEVFLAIANRYHRLRHLVVSSEDKAHILTKLTMMALTEGCPLLCTVDFSGALVVFEEGALETLHRLVGLQSVSIP